jgi:hypothetical protein
MKILVTSGPLAGQMRSPIRAGIAGLNRHNWRLAVGVLHLDRTRMHAVNSQLAVVFVGGNRASFIEKR